VSQVDINETYDCLLDAMGDYTTDKRGDIGSWVREAAMATLKVNCFLNTSQLVKCKCYSY
jgi:hypothetical protein